ncbi:hypothetical protein [Streptomyces sp. NPDC060022]|uniref:hypothetical protein n=1 Tax=Streptomyces sp. NPDC060022 TaxID=3347039 RepID=UPI0036BA6255
MPARPLPRTGTQRRRHGTALPSRWDPDALRGRWLIDGILFDLGKRIADRWFAFLILPGVPFAATVAVAWAMAPSGAAHALDLDVLVRRLDALVGTARSTKGVVVGCLVFAGVAVTAVLVREMSLLVNRLWTGRSALLCRLMGPGIRRRRRLALDAARRGGYASPERYLPHRATWIGDRFALVDERVAVQYGVSSPPRGTTTPPRPSASPGPCPTWSCPSTGGRPPRSPSPWCSSAGPRGAAAPTTSASPAKPRSMSNSGAWHTSWAYRCPIGA